MTCRLSLTAQGHHQSESRHFTEISHPRKPKLFTRCSQAIRLLHRHFTKHPPRTRQANSAGANPVGARLPAADSRRPSATQEAPRLQHNHEPGLSSDCMYIDCNLSELFGDRMEILTLEWIANVCAVSGLSTRTVTVWNQSMRGTVSLAFVCRRGSRLRRHLPTRSTPIAKMKTIVYGAAHSSHTISLLYQCILTPPE